MSNEFRWYFPSWNGDHRLIADGDVTVLEIERPTWGEAEALRKFLAKAKRKGWISEVPEVREGDHPYRSGPVSIDLVAPIEKAAKALADSLRARRGRITAVRYEDDVLVVDREQEVRLPAKPEDPQPRAAVTTKRGTLCCPKPLPVNVRASEALLAFLDDEQLEQWLAQKRIAVHGGYTGCAYVIAHRGSEFARRNGFICRSIDDNAAVHYYDWSVPPEEEVLGLKLILEHREDWVRNPSGCFARDRKFHNPLGHDSMDGTKDTAFLDAFGHGFIDGLKHGLGGGR